MPKFTVTSLGCKVNQYESAAITEALRMAGLTECLSGQLADLVVVHTCCVTATAAAKSRQLIRRLRVEHPGARIVMTGCYATSNDQEVHRLPGVTAIAGHEADLAACLSGVAGELLTSNTTRPPEEFEVKTFRDSPPPGPGGLPALSRFPNRQRAIVKVQDGCDAFCSYCIVPHLRRTIVSRPVEAILDEVRQLAGQGHREIVFCGVSLGAFGQPTTRRRNWPGPGQLAGLVGRVAGVQGVDRLRLSSLSPADVTDDLLDTMAGRANVCPHLHLPLQSGSEAVLRRMNRQYSAEQFCRTVEHARRRIDRLSVTTDVIVGFPGESQADFADTLRVCEQVGFSKIHIFPFSPRTGTAAWDWRSEMPPAEQIKARCRELARLEKQLARQYRRQFLGQIVEVLVEDGDQGTGNQDQGPGTRDQVAGTRDQGPRLGEQAVGVRRNPKFVIRNPLGFTPHYVRVSIKGATAPLAGQIVQAEVIGENSAGLEAELFDKSGGMAAPPGSRFASTRRP